MAKPKCKYCDEEILTKDDKMIFLEKTKNGKEKKVNIHKKCEMDYKELMEYKANELHWFDEVYEYLKDLLGYTEEQRLSNALITRVQDLRNGTIMKRGQGRVIKSKEGYKYEIIYDCLLTNGDGIRWAFKNKTFNKESDKINYMMAIISNSINDSYEAYQSRQRIKSRIDNEIIEEEIKISETVKKVSIPIEKPKTGISKFLDEDDL